MINRQKSSANHEPTVNYDLSPFMPHNLNLNRSATFENEVKYIYFFIN
jgi:hypothetical protein